MKGEQGKGGARLIRSIIGVPCASALAVPAASADLGDALPSSESLSQGRNDKLASLTGPNKGKTHITQCGRGAAVVEHGSFFTGRVDFVLQDGHRQGKEGGDGKTVMASCTLSRRVPLRQRVGATRRTSPQSSGAIVHRQHRGRVQNLGWFGRRRVRSRVCT